MSKRILMCRPDHFRVFYAINPWMEGVPDVNTSLAIQQWNNLKSTLEKCGAKVDVMDGAPKVPDIVFTANAALVYGKKAFLSHFMHPERQGETPIYKKWFEKMGFQTYYDPEIPFEGAGDALFAGNKLFAGHGQRTDKRIYAKVQEAFHDENIKFLPCELVTERFYHIDVSMCPLNSELAMFYPPAFSEETRKMMENEMELIPVSDKDAHNLACNMVVVGKQVVLPANNKDTMVTLEKRGYEPHSVDVSEFLKAGGACKCLTLRVE